MEHDTLITLLSHEFFMVTASSNRFIDSIEPARKNIYHDKNTRRRTSIMKVDVGVEVFFNPFVMF